MAGTFYSVAATDGTQNMVTVTTVYYRFQLVTGDQMVFYKNTQEYVGTVGFWSSEHGPASDGSFCSPSILFLEHDP